MFLSTEHATRYQELLLRDSTHPRDVERQALFYLFSGSDDLHKKINFLYDFEEHSIKPECLEGSVDLSSGARALVYLAFNLYNSFPSPSIIDIFAPLDEHGRLMALEAIKLRFRMESDESVS